MRLRKLPGWLPGLTVLHKNLNPRLNEYASSGRVAHLKNLPAPRIFEERMIYSGTLAKETGLHKVMYTMGSNFGDLDNDGYLDFYVGTGDTDMRVIMPNRMFRNVNGSRFEEVTASGGFGHLQKGHAVSFADLNNNGQQAKTDLFSV